MSVSDKKSLLAYKVLCRCVHVFAATYILALGKEGEIF